MPPEEKLFFKISPSKIFKPSNALATQTDPNTTRQMTAKLTADKDFTTSVDRWPACNRRLAKVAVQCSADSFVVNQSLVLRINICGENRHLRQAQNRYVPL
ncbi:MAG: hypothetical protein ABIS12_11105 [Bacteroidia bacterium]